MALACAAVLAPGESLAQVKVGVVNLARVMDVAPQAKAASARLEKEFAPRDREMLAQQQEVRTLEDKMVKNSAVMSETERQRQDTEIRAMRRELRRMRDEFQEDVNLRRTQELGKLQSKVVDVIQAMGKEGKYDIIVTGDGVVYVSDRTDITDTVITRLKKEFKARN